MPLRPFPFELGLGIDIVHIPRIHRIISKATLQNPVPLYRFLARVLTNSERQAFWARFKTLDNCLGAGLQDTTKHLSGRWAAKEAVVKAVKLRPLTFRDIEIRTFHAGNQRGGVHAIILDHPAPESYMTKTLKLQKSSETSAVPETINLGASLQDFANVDGVEATARDARSATDPSVKDPPGQIAKVSISHDGEYATAVCLAVNEPMPGDVGGEAAARML